MKYSGNSYGGQVASVGRVVVANIGGAIVAGFIETIAKDSVPNLNFYGDSYRVAPGPEEAESWGGQYFVPTKTVEDVEALLERAWTWPVRV